MAVSEISELDVWLAQHALLPPSTHRICQQRSFREICVVSAVMLTNPIAKS
jgi:hypothetical protein